MFRSTCIAASIVAFATLSSIGTDAAVAAEGGSTIASSPRLVWGHRENGVGTHYLTPHPGDGRTFWHAHVRRGDRITITLKVASTNGCAVNQIQIFSPSTTDRTVSSASPIDAKYVGHGSACFKADYSPRRTTHWQIRSVPFHGRARLWFGISSEAPAFSFTARVHHRHRRGQHDPTG